MNSLDKLKEAVKDAPRSTSTRRVSRQKLKRELLDKLDEMHKFALPPTLVEDEFSNVWTAVEGDLKAQGRTFADEGTTEEKAREEYRGIAERRVRLGLVLAEIGEKNNIKVTEEEITRAVVERARQIPGREQEIWDYYRKNPQAVAEHAGADLRGEGGRLPGRACHDDGEAVSREELFKEEEDEKAAAPDGRASRIACKMQAGHAIWRPGAMRGANCVLVLRRDAAESSACGGFRLYL